MNRYVLGAVAIIAVACGGAPAAGPAAAPGPPASAAAPSGVPEPPRAPTKEPVETGKACAKAVSECGGGVCAVTIDNACEEPVTCNLAIVATCRGAEMGEAKGRSRGTVASGKKSDISATADCQGANVVRTEVRSFTCT